MTHRKLKVLLADDVRLELEIEETFFQRSGFSVLTATDGPAAVALAVSERPDLVILDQIMPGMLGTEACAALKARPETRHIPVVITSSQDQENLPAACKAAGADSFVPKSAGRDALLRLAARILQVPQRKSTRITVCFTVQGIVGVKESLGKAVQLSESGMCLETTRSYNVRDLFLLRFLLPADRQEIQAWAQVLTVTQRPDGVFSLGLEFTDLKAEDRTRLNQHLDMSFAGR